MSFSGEFRFEMSTDRLVDSRKSGIVFEGTPADLVAARSTLTGEHLAAFVGGLLPRPSI